MLKALKSKFTIALLIVALLLIATICVYKIPTAQAENTSVVVDLKADSKFSAYGEVFAYTYDTTICVVQDNVIKSYPKAFTGTCIDIEINATNILLLAKNGTQYSIYYFDYDSYGIKSAATKLGALGNNYSALLSDEAGTFYLIRNFSTDFDQLKVFKEDTSADNLTQIQLIDPSYAITDYIYVASTTTLYAIINGEIYYANTGNPIGSANPFTKLDGIEGANSLSMSSDEIIVNSTNGIYKITISANAVSQLSTTGTNGIIEIVEINSQKYIFVLASNAITQYLYNGTTCEYYNKFNNSEYKDPTTFDLVYVASALASTNIYSSPRNMQIASTLVENEYFMVLCKVTNEESGEYFYIVKEDGTKGYIKSDASFTTLSANTDVKSFDIGLYAQGLHASTNIYKYPYNGAEVLTTVTIYDELVVIDNVAEKDGVQVWGYYKVSYVKDGEIITGYVEDTDVSPYTQLSAPTILKTVKISSGSIGSLVYLYALPSEESIHVAELTDGVEIDLAEEYNKNSTWTKVVYDGTYAYVLTSQISPKGLTGVQITLIVISVIVVVASIVMLVIMKKKRKIGF